MAVCCCSLAGTAACQHCAQNPFATDVWTNKTVTVDHIDATPFGNGIDVCPVCGKPSTIGKPQTNADRIRAMSDEELADYHTKMCGCPPGHDSIFCGMATIGCKGCWLDWLKSPVEEVDNERFQVGIHRTVRELLLSG